MDAAQALSDLTEISSQIEAAVVLDANGAQLASTLEGGRGEDFATAVQELLAAVGRVAGREPVQAEVSTGEGSVFLVRDGERSIAATTAPEPTVGLVFYDLKSCLRAFGDEPKPKPRPKRAKKEESDAPA
jgi:predicted regulator of Ras-like GTPase activity (Roadblock/LC7/MglB family)